MVIHEYGNPSAKTVLIQPVDEHDLAGMENEVESIRKLAGDEFRLLAVEIRDWNRELSPWQAPAVFGKEGFGAGAAETLAEIMKLCEDGSKTYFIGGYSLAGLFAIWAAYQTDVFKGVAAASPSMWFPGFADYMRENIIHANPHAGAAPAQIGMKTEAAKFSVFLYTMLERGTLQSTGR